MKTATLAALVSLVFTFSAVKAMEQGPSSSKVRLDPPFAGSDGSYTKLSDEPPRWSYRGLEVPKLTAQRHRELEQYGPHTEANRMFAMGRHNLFATAAFQQAVKKEASLRSVREELQKEHSPSDVDAFEQRQRRLEGKVKHYNLLSDQHHDEADKLQRAIIENPLQSEEKLASAFKVARF